MKPHTQTTTKQTYTEASILAKLQGNLTLEERKSFLEELVKSPQALALLTLVDPLWRVVTLNLKIEIEKTKEFIRIYSIWSKSKLAGQNQPEHEKFYKKLDDFLVLAKYNSQNDEYVRLREKVAYIFGEEVIHCFCQKNKELLQLKASLKSERKKAELTLELMLDILKNLHDNLVLTNPNQQKSKDIHGAGFFSLNSKEKCKMLEVDVTEEEMVNSAFGQRANTVRFI